MAHRGDDRDGGGGDRPRSDLLIKCPQVLERAAAAPDDQDVEAAQPVQVLDPGRHLSPRARALHAHRPHDDAARGPAPPEHRPHVVDHGAAERGDDADRTREAQQGALAPGGEQALGPEAGLQLLEGELQRAQAARLHGVDVELEGAARRIEADARGNQHLHAVCGPEGEYLRGAPEEDRAELAVLVLEREVDVSRRRGAEVRDLARHPHSPHPALERLAHQRGELGDGQDARRGFGTEHRPRLHITLRGAPRRS